MAKNKLKEFKINLLNEDYEKVSNVAAKYGMTIEDLLTKVIVGWANKTSYDKNDSGRTLKNFLCKLNQFEEFMEAIHGIENATMFMEEGMNSPYVTVEEMKKAYSELTKHEITRDLFVLNFKCGNPYADMEVKIKECLEWEKERNKFLSLIMTP